MRTPRDVWLKYKPELEKIKKRKGMVAKEKFDTIHLKAKNSVITIKLNDPVEAEITEEGRALVAKEGWDRLKEYVLDMLSESNTNFSYCVE